MTKQEFVARVAEKSGLSGRDARKAVDAFLDSITDALKTGDSVTFTGFGKFSTSSRRAREGVSPHMAGQKVAIPAARVPKFSAKSSLKVTATEMRRNAANLDKEYRDFESRIEGSKRALHDIAVS